MKYNDLDSLSEVLDARADQISMDNEEFTGSEARQKANKGIRCSQRYFDAEELFDSYGDD